MHRHDAGPEDAAHDAEDSEDDAPPSHHDESPSREDDTDDAYDGFGDTCDVDNQAHTGRHDQTQRRALSFYDDGGDARSPSMPPARRPSDSSPSRSPPLLALPPELLTLIALHLGTLTPSLGPPSSLLPLLLTCRALYLHLRWRNWALWGGLGRAKFACSSAMEGAERGSLKPAAHVLKSRCIALRTLRAGNVYAPDAGDVLINAYWMLIGDVWPAAPLSSTDLPPLPEALRPLQADADSDAVGGQNRTRCEAKNRRQLAWAGARDFALRYVRLRLYEARFGELDSARDVGTEWKFFEGWFHAFTTPHRETGPRIRARDTLRAELEPVRRALMALLLPFVAVPFRDTLCQACNLGKDLTGAGPFDATQLFNGTVTSFLPSSLPASTVIEVDAGVGPRDDNAIHRIEFDFNADPETSLEPVQDKRFHLSCSFTLDGAFVGNLSRSPHDGGPGSYNILAYRNLSIPDGAHNMRIDINSGLFNFDYAIHTSFDLDPSSSSLSPSTSSLAGPTSSGLSHAQGPAVVPNRNSKASAVVIASSTIAGVAAILVVISGILLCRRTRRQVSVSPSHAAESGLAAAHSGGEKAISLMDSEPAPRPTVTLQDSGPSAVAVTDELRVLREQLARLEERVDGGSLVGLEAGPPTRSLSTMKRQQTQALQAACV
ncbi:hypothetical protein B0H15DRAFT_956684 [Mycena belliarum]|uniref:Uncharacterized protein n=1 Tax=Mycena belliarum TaxID=1033014 RepID=A0AAD6TU10_9AGAR|nr:hypothetical protein B0H15DRAFT_956684 [Mycena belliae]